jgi:autophagy-related protein 9
MQFSMINSNNNNIKERPSWRDIYSYYIDKDINKHILTSCFSVLSLLFLQFLVILISLCVDWKRLLSCDDNCENLGKYLTSPFTLSYLSMFIWINTAVILVYICFISAMYHNRYKSLKKVNKYITSIGLSQYHIKTMKWDDLITHIDNINPDLLNEEKETIRSKSMILESRRDIVKTKMLIRQLIKEGLIKKQFYTRLADWILSGIFSDAFYIGSAKEIANRSRYLGVISIITLPFSLIPIIIYYIVKHAESVHEKRDYVGPRNWTLYSTLYFRKHDELFHEVEYRLSCAEKHVGLYLDQFPTPWLDVVARFISFVSSSFMTIFVLIALYNENIMLHVFLYNRNMIFYLGIFTSIFALSRIMNNEKANHSTTCELSDNSDLPYNPKSRMSRILEYIQPSNDKDITAWKTQSDTYPVRNDIISYYPVRVFSFGMVLITIIFLPYILIYHIPKRSEHIYQIIRRTTERDRVLGWTTNTI